MRIQLEAVNPAAIGRECVTWHSMSAVVGQAVLAALLTRLPPIALGRIRESFPSASPGSGPGELLVAITLPGEMPGWAREIFP